VVWFLAPHILRMAARSSEVDHMEGTPDLLYSHDWDFGSVLPLVAKLSFYISDNNRIF